MKGGKQSEPSAGLPPLQQALLVSMFGGRVKITKDFNVENFKCQALKVWSQRAVPDAVANFLKEHAHGVPLPKPKEALLQLFCDTLGKMS